MENGEWRMEKNESEWWRKRKESKTDSDAKDNGKWSGVWRMEDGGWKQRKGGMR